MSGSVKIETHDHSLVVDLTNLNPSVQYIMNNPLFIVPVLYTKQVVFDLKLQTLKFIVTFDLTDGIGTGSNFKKLIELSRKTGIDYLNFTWGADVYVNVRIESLAMGTRAGEKDLLRGCTMVIIPSIRLDEDTSGFW